MNIINLGSIVDTLKINANFTNVAFELDTINQDEIIEKKILDFNDKIDELIIEKSKAQSILSHDAQKRYTLITLDGVEYRVMASASASYSVILQNGDISIFLRKFSKKVSNPVLKVEFRAEFLARCGYIKAVKMVLRMVESVFIDNPVYKVNEIHLATDIQGYEFSPLDFYRIKSLSKNRAVYSQEEENSYFSNQRFTGMTFGKGDFMLRIYNKTIEINKNKKKGFIEVLKWQNHENFDKNSNVWRIEGQIRRDKLKELCMNETIIDDNGNEIKLTSNLDSLETVLRAIPSIWNLFVSRFVHKNISANDIHEQMQGYKIKKDGSIKILLASAFKQRFKKSELSTVWSSILTFNGHVGSNIEKFEDIKKPEVEYVENAYKALVSTFTKLKRGNFDTNELIELIHNANYKYFDKKGYSILDGARLNALDYMSSAKIYYDKFGFSFDGFDDFQSNLWGNLKSIVNPTITIHNKMNNINYDSKKCS